MCNSQWICVAPGCIYLVLLLLSALFTRDNQFSILLLCRTKSILIYSIFKKHERTKGGGWSLLEVWSQSVTSDAEKYGDNAEREVCCDFLLFFEDAYDLMPLPLDYNRLPPLLPCSYPSPSFYPFPSLSSLPFFFLFQQNFTSSPLFFPSSSSRSVWSST